MLPGCVLGRQEPLPALLEGCSGIAPAKFHPRLATLLRASPWLRVGVKSQCKTEGLTHSIGKTKIDAFSFSQVCAPRLATSKVYITI